MRSGDPLISTFHSFCVRLLRREIEALNYTRDFTIYDESDQLQVIKAAMKDLKVDERLVTAKTIQSRISHAKNHGKTPQNLLDDSWEPSWEYTAKRFHRIRQAAAQIECARLRRSADQDGRAVRQVSADGREIQRAFSSTSWWTSIRTRIGSSIGWSVI